MIYHLASGKREGFDKDMIDVSIEHCLLSHKVLTILKGMKRKKGLIVCLIGML